MAAGVGKLLVAREKHGDRYFYIGDTPMLHRVALMLLKERLDESWYDNGDDVTGMDLAVIKTSVHQKDGATAWKILQEHRHYEYEDVQLTNFEGVPS